MTIIFRSWVLALLLVGLVGCSFLRSGPPPENVEAAIKAALPAYLGFSLGKTDLMKLGDKNYQVGFKGTVYSKEDLFVISDVAKEYQKHGLVLPDGGHSFFARTGGNSDSTPPLKLLSLSVPANQKYEVYGKCIAEYIVDKWNVVFCGILTLKRTSKANHDQLMALTILSLIQWKPMGRLVR